MSSGGERWAYIMAISWQIKKNSLYFIVPEILKCVAPTVTRDFPSSLLHGQHIQKENPATSFPSRDIVLSFSLSLPSAPRSLLSLSVFPSHTGGEQAFERLWLVWHIRNQREKKQEGGMRRGTRREGQEKRVSQENCQGHLEVVNIKESLTDND